MTEQKERLVLSRCIQRAKRMCANSSVGLEQASEEVKKLYNISELKRQQLVNFFQQKVEKTKVKEMRHYIRPEYPVAPKKYTAHQEMRDFADCLPTTPISKYTELDILKMVQIQKIQDRYPETKAKVMQEIRELFWQTTHEAGIICKIRPPDGSDQHVILAPYKYKGRTDNYDNYLKTRTQIRRILFTCYPLNAKILKLCVMELPDILIDFSKYRDVPRDHQKISDILEDEISKASDRIKAFYDKVITIGQSDKTKFTKHSRKVNYWRTGTGILSTIFTRLLLNTINHLVEVTGNDNKIPYLFIYLNYNHGFTLSPSQIETFDFYTDIVYKICQICSNLRTLESVFCETEESKFIPINVLEEHTSQAISTIKNNIDLKYKDILAYIETLEEKFELIYNDEAIEEVQDMTFDEGKEKIELYQTYTYKVLEMVSNVYYPIGVLKKDGGKASLIKSVENLINAVADKLVLQHEWENRDICETFEMLAVKAVTMPTTTDELMEQGAYMTWANTVLMAELTERITKSLEILARLIEMTTISQEHFELNSKTVNWLQKIKPIMLQNSVLFEATKSAFEERLQNAIQKLNDGTQGFFPLLLMLDEMDDVDNSRDYINQLSHMLVMIRDFEAQKAWINMEEASFKFPLSPFPDLAEIKDYVYPFYKLCKLGMNWKRMYGAWMDGPFEFLDFPAAEIFLDDYFKELTKIQKTYRNKIRQMIAENNPRRFRGSVDDPDVLNQPAPLKLTWKTLSQIKEFRPTLQLMGIMCNSALLQRHWDEMSNLAGFDLTPNAGTTLRKISEMDLKVGIDCYEIISSGAIKELMLITNLRKMQAEWDDVKFKTSTFKDTGLNILSGLDDIQALLDDHILKTLSLRGSVFVKPYEAEVKSWYEKIIRINNTIEEWGKVQVTWLYLMPIFSSKDIVAQMPIEGGLFKEVDAVFRRYMAAVVRDPRVLETAPQAGLLEAMQNCNQMLEKINDGVTQYLEKKRLFFPRFFFLSNDEMLEILSETKDPLRVQPHLRKCFEAINRLEFDSKLMIHAMFSVEMEKIDFLDPINTEEAHGAVEKWLVQVETQMLVSVKEQMLRSYIDYPKIKRTLWVQNWPGQIVLCVSQIYWAISVHKCFGQPDYNEVTTDLRTRLRKDLTDIVRLIRDPKLTSLARITIKALIVIDVHAKDVVEDLVKNNVRKDNEFKWLAQLRYYWEEDKCIIRLINAIVVYACEYLGNSDRLVITPLTDRCYRTLVGAYHLHLNGAPEGPAGTGKTETTKDLAKALAVQCVVFNCSDGLDYKAMGKFFKGLASSGAWACFDEFNRIEIEVLSVVAQQILCIIQAVRTHQKKFVFEGTELILNPSCYVCITMNPGYAGRTELPDNLKVLFRTVAMMVPDYAMIGEISLYSFGFIDARTLSVKIVTTYRLCSEQLSSQNHYDYGMRAVKSVLSAAGNNKRDAPDENEDILLLRAILDVNLPKFLSHDVPLFDGIISDLFPGVKKPETDYNIFLNIMKDKCKIKNLQSRESFQIKVIQTYEMMIVRHGFMVVGDPFSGKTSTLQILADILTQMNINGLPQLKVQYKIINPKSITMGQLYGQFDPVSYEWTDGVVATSFRSFVVDEAPDRKWVIFDGPVDAVWIENMNTVLDDNKKLCLMSGEVMAMTNSMSMIFEVMDLSQASPATVSRCGMIYMESSTLGWRPFVESWLKTCNTDWCTPPIQKFILEIMDWIVPPSLRFILKFCTQMAVINCIGQVKATYQMIEMLMDDAFDFANYSEDAFKNQILWLEAAFLYSVVWGLGGLLDVNSREKFDEFYKNIWRLTDEDNPPPASIDKVEASIPQEGLIFDYIYIFKGKGMWKHCLELSKSQQVPETANIQQVLIPTIDSVRYIHCINMHINHGYRILLTGPTGTGKSFYIQDMMMKQLNEDKFVPAFITFTVKISANQCQELVISKLFKRRRGMYGAPKGKTCVLFVDDINMPAKEIYGAQPPIELLRQFFDHKNWYDLKDTSPIYLYDVLFIAAMGLPGGSRQEIYPRFLRHYSVFSINEFSEDSMSKIYTNILLNGLKKNGFPSDVISNVNQVVPATLDFYQQAIANLRPTPAKSHYVFNLRDFSRVIFGCALMRKESAENKKIFAKLWVHEIMRVFYDRLIDPKDKHWLYDQLKVSVKSFFKEQFDMLFENLERQDGVVPESSLSKLLFGTYLDTDANEDDMRYEEVLDLDQFRNISLNSLDDYNASHKTKMDIVLFDFALEHLSKICRILSLATGSALLVGVSGSGRQSLTKLAATIYGQTFFQPEITNTYAFNDWRDDIKKVLKESGGRGKHTVFLFTEGQIKEEAYLQDIDGLLNSGEVPNIFPIDEQQEIMEMVRLAAQGGNRNLDISALTVFNFFIKRCREKLHIILCFSPIGSSFRMRLRLYPSLVNCCTIDWFEDWPEEALQMVASTWIEEINAEEDVKVAAVVACKEFHIVARRMTDEFYKLTSRKTYITSASYLELIKSFTALTNKKQKDLTEAKFRYTGGLGKLEFASKQIAEMQLSLEAIQPELTSMQAKAIEMTKQIATETIQVERASAQVKKEEAVANVMAAEAQALKTECEADLAEAIPILEEAISALNTLKPADITLVKSMKNPPEVVKLVMAAVCVMKNIAPDKISDPSTGKKILDYWGPSKRILGDMNFLQSLKDFDKDNIKAETMVIIRKQFLPDPYFKPQIVAKASTAAEGLCKWIIALDSYDKVAKVVAPKKEKLAKAEKDFAETMALLNEKKATVARLEERLANLNEMLEEATIKQQDLQDNVDLCNNKIIRANKLIGGLGGEKSRWTAAAENLQYQYDHLAGDILMCCGIIAYLATLTSLWRAQAVDEWYKYVVKLGIPCSDTFDFQKLLGSEVKIQNWYISALPRDSFSTENAIIQDSSRRWSLLIDPQSQANIWIKKMEKVNNLTVTKFNDPNYMKILETAIQMGRPVLLEGVAEDLEPPLDPILFKNTFVQAGMEFISLGDNVIPYSKDFKFYLTSKLRNPHYLPEVFNKVTIINFALTIEGLQDQLLGIVVAQERPDLQRQREVLIQQDAQNKAALLDVENNILRTLAESKGDILEDETAIQILDSSKILSTEIKEKQKVAAETQKKIEKFRLDYRPIADHSAVLYYCIADLPNVDPMYQYSLGWFINLYLNSIETANKSRDLEKRLFFLKETFTYNLYSNVCRSLFEKDKIMFSFILTTKLMLFQKELDPAELKFLLTGGVSTENPLPNPAGEWLIPKSWDEICRLNDLSIFGGFREFFTKNVAVWQKIYDSQNPHEAMLPEPWQSKLSPFQRLIIVRVIRGDKVSIAITNFIANTLGIKFIQPPPFDIAKSYTESSCLCPLIFILSTGTDPMGALLKFAEMKGFADRFESISLGQGQGPIAKMLIEKAQDGGSWVCLQNCHLATSWMPSLEGIWESFDASNTHAAFRLWLTSYPSPKFPVSMLQYGVKMTNEPPTGLSMNLLRSFINEPVKNPEYWAGCPGRDVMFSKLLYGIAFFHAVIQERRTFGPLGWNIPYGFNESDFDISVQQLQMFINEYTDNPYEAIVYLTGECNYGGRVTDDWDRRLIVTILDDFINPNVASNPNYSFSDAGTCYGLPKKFEYQDYINHINNLPLSHPPDVCGLHSNAGITKDLQISNALLNAMISVEGEGKGGGGGEEGDLITFIAGEILSKLPKNFDMEEAKNKYPVIYSESMNTVLVQEMERFNKLLSTIRSSLINSQKAVKGLVIMTNALEALISSLLLGRIPEAWAKVSYPSLKSLANYVSDFVERMNFLNKWCQKGKPSTFWISGFFFTQAFLTGAKQNYARKYIIPIDQLTFDFTVQGTNEIATSAKDGVYVNGIFTDGGRYDRTKDCIAELFPKILYDVLPAVLVMPIKIADYSDKGRYKAPLYKTSERRGILSTTGHSTNYVVPIMLKTDRPISHWIKRSFALLLQLD